MRTTQCSNFAVAYKSSVQLNMWGLRPFSGRPRAEFLLNHRPLDVIYGGFSAKPKKCVIVNLLLKLHAVFNIFG